MNSLKNHPHMRMKKMTAEDWIIFIQFASHLLYMYVAFMCGVIVGYIVGIRNGGDF